MKDPTLWLLIGIGFGFLLRLAHEYLAELRRMREEAERIEREQRLQFLKVMAICAVYLAHRRRPDLFPLNPLEPNSKWPPS
jgi:hypothetical protein